MTKTLDDYRQELYQCRSDTEIRDFLYRSYASIYAYIMGKPFHSSISVVLVGDPSQKLYFNISAHEALHVLRAFAPDVFGRSCGGGWNISAHVEKPFVPQGGYCPTAIDMSEHIAAMHAATGWDAWWNAWLVGLGDFARQRLHVQTTPEWVETLIGDVRQWMQDKNIVMDFPRIHAYPKTTLGFVSSFTGIEPVFHFPDSWRVLFEDNPLVEMYPGRSVHGSFCAQPRPYWDTLNVLLDECITSHRHVTGKNPPVYWLAPYFRTAEFPPELDLPTSFFDRSNVP